jgi:CBS domain-containing protein
MLLFRKAAGAPTLTSWLDGRQANCHDPASTHPDCGTLANSPASISAADRMTPSPSLLHHLTQELRAHEPFKRLREATLAQLLAGAHEAYFAPGEVVLAPASGVVQHLFWIRRGAVNGHASDGPAFALEVGEVFPLGALIGERATRTRYLAEADLFCLVFEGASVQRAIELDPVWADFVNKRLQTFVALSRQQLQAAYASQVLAEQSFETPLAHLPQRAPVAVGSGASLHDALLLMQQQRVGSVLVLSDAGAALGILTRHDLLDRVALREPPLATRDVAIGSVMSTPVHTLDIGARVHDAALLMSQHGVRHVPITQAGRVVSMLSERDLFALQKLSLKALSSSLRQAADVATLRSLAPGIREFARQLLAQGLAARSLTSLISHLNDVLTQRLLQLTVQVHGLDLQRACWLAFGSEGRSEQTIATDQDNGLVLADDVDDAEHARWLAMAREVNQQLDACGYPLCQGGVMAGNAACCLRLHEWQTRFAQWIEHGAPQDLLQASIYFDVRALAGNAALATPLRDSITAQAAAVPRFLHQLAHNALQRRPALNWRGGIDSETVDGHAWLDLKLGGTAVFVDAARLLALAQGIPAVSTAERLALTGQALGVAPAEREGWVSAFEVLQQLRLRVQVGAGAQGGLNQIDVATLNDIDRRLLKDALRLARRLQQRIALDWQA